HTDTAALGARGPRERIVVLLHRAEVSCHFHLRREVSQRSVRAETETRPRSGGGLSGGAASRWLHFAGRRRQAGNSDNEAFPASGDQTSGQRGCRGWGCNR